MPDNTAPKQTETQDHEEDKPDLSALANTVVTSQLKRMLPNAVNTAVAQATAPLIAQITALTQALQARGDTTAAEQKPTGTAAPPSNPSQPTTPSTQSAATSHVTTAPPVADTTMQRRLEEMERKLRESETARQTEALQQRKNEVRAEIRQRLEAKGIKGTRQKAVLTMLEADGVVQFGEDGKASVVVRRSRGRNRTVEEQSFEDLHAGMDDWMQSPEAAEFLPPPTPAPVPRLGSRSSGPPVVPKGVDGKPRALTGADAEAVLNSAGLSFADVLNKD